MPVLHQILLDQNLKFLELLENDPGTLETHFSFII